MIQLESRRESSPTAADADRASGQHDLGFALPEPARISRGRAIALGTGLVAILGLAFASGFVPLHREREALSAATKAAGPLRVDVVTPSQTSSERAIGLPGSVQALEETIVYPRASGYLRKWHVDLGDKVAEGDLLAEIDTPEIDQQIAQARAELARSEASLVQAKANAGFSKQNLDRYEKLAPSGITSQEELEKTRAQSDVSSADVSVANANVEAQRANLQRLAQLKSFARVLAPFAGTVAARMVERGALVSAGNASPLFKISATDPVRVFVQVPQDIAGSVKVGANAQVTVREFPGRTFDGQIARSAGSLDSSTRTMTTEVRVPNPKGELLSGMYAEVSLKLPTSHRVFELPATALLNDAKGLRVAVVGQDSHVRLVPVVLERDTGATIEIASGIDGSEKIVKLASGQLTDGAVVEVAH
jgi:RND family efflux transporter MFP subunit